MEHDRQALTILTRALGTDPDNYQLLWRAARAYYHVGDEASDSEKQRYFERGIETGSAPWHNSRQELRAIFGSQQITVA